MYKNAEGYSDPMAGNAESNVNKCELRKQKRLEAMQATEDYEQLCRDFRAKAEERGFHFINDIWLVNDMTGRVHRGG
ncbi:MAG: hypothetical protein LBQ15_04310 [Clostridium sp.]|jgi:hypothetical protein|nr:hypothetical protein [Clostridium sp.]